MEAILQMFDAGTFATLITLALTVSTAVLGVKWKKYAKLVGMIIDAVEDGEVSKEELNKIVKYVKKL